MKAHDNSTGKVHPDCGNPLCLKKNCVASTTGDDLWCCYCGAHNGKGVKRRSFTPNPSLPTKPSSDVVRRRYFIALPLDTYARATVWHEFNMNSPKAGFCTDKLLPYLDMGADAVSSDPPSLDSANRRAVKALEKRGRRIEGVYFSHAEWVVESNRGPG